MNYGTKHETLTIKAVSRKFKRVVDRKKFKNEKQKKKGAYYNCATKGHFAKECNKTNNIGKNKFKGFSQVTTTRKIELLVISLSISKICRDAWFINSRASQHLTFQKEVLSTFEEFTLNHKIYLRDNNIFDVCGKDTIVFNLPNKIFKCVGDVLYVPKLAKI